MIVRLVNIDLDVAQDGALVVAAGLSGKIFALDRTGRTRWISEAVKGRGQQVTHLFLLVMSEK